MPRHRTHALLTAAILALPGHPLANEAALTVRHTIYPGQAITNDELTELDITGCAECRPGFLSDPAVFAGMVATKTLLPGRLIYPDALRTAIVVRPGQAIEVLYRSGALTISMAGEPLKEGGVGDFVPVRNRESGAIINGVVQTNGTIIVRSN